MVSAGNIVVFLDTRLQGPRWVQIDALAQRIAEYSQRRSFEINPVYIIENAKTIPKTRSRNCVLIWTISSPVGRPP
jgi:hypothetical protein